MQLSHFEHMNYWIMVAFHQKCHCCSVSVTMAAGDEYCIFTASQLWPIIQLASCPGSSPCVRVYIVDTARRVSLIYLDSRWLFLFGLPVHYRFQLFSKWQNKLYWSDLSSPAICATATSDNAEYFGPPGVKNYTYFSLDEKRPHLNHQSLLTGGWLSRINFGIFLLLRANGCWPALSNGFQRFQPLALLMQVNGSVLWAETPTYWTRPVVPEQETACSAS